MLCSCESLNQAPKKTLIKPNFGPFKKAFQNLIQTEIKSSNVRIPSHEKLALNSQPNWQLFFTTFRIFFQIKTLIETLPCLRFRSRVFRPYPRGIQTLPKQWTVHNSEKPFLLAVSHYNSNIFFDSFFSHLIIIIIIILHNNLNIQNPAPLQHLHGDQTLPLRRYHHGVQTLPDQNSEQWLIKNKHSFTFSIYFTSSEVFVSTFMYLLCLFIYFFILLKSFKKR